MIKISLDQAYKPNLNKTTLFVIDCRVAVFKLLKLASIQDSLESLPYLVQYYFSSLPWDIYSDWPNPPQVLLVDDTRVKLDSGEYNYWREQWIRDNRPELPVYKGNRGVSSEADRPDFYTEVLEAIYLYCNQTNIPIFKGAGFEADDWYGAIYRYANSNPDYVDKYQTFIISVDNDLSQLVSDKLDIIMYVSGSFKCPVSRLRSEYEVLRYYQEQHMVKLLKPTDVITYKMEYGDAGDNIIPGSPREIIDLIDPPVKPEAYIVANIMDNYKTLSVGRPLNKLAALSALNKINLH